MSTLVTAPSLGSGPLLLTSAGWLAVRLHAQDRKDDLPSGSGQHLHSCPGHLATR